MSLAGRTVSHYEIVEEIGRGGMGVVYRATDTRLNRDVALKVLPPDLMTDRERRERFIREARAASALEHPHIAVIHDIGEEDGISFIAMELIRGDKLSQAIADGQFNANPGRGLDVSIEVGEALARAHSQGIVHRDLKPANVMLTEDGHVKVIDFGLAKLLGSLSGDDHTMTAAATNPAVVLGTVAYMAPEQARGGPIDHRADIFAFGILLYELFGQTVPFKGASTVETMHAILHGTPAPVSFPAAMPVVAADDLRRIIEKCLAKDPNDRYQGMKDLVVDLKSARRHLDTASMTATVPISRAVARRPSNVLIGAVSIAALVAVGLWVWAIPSRAPVAQATGTRPSVAVLHFENNTGNPAMDWLRTGLTDMLVTDLSQSTDVEVVSTDRVVQILRDIGKLDERTIDSETIHELARRARVQHVLLGSYVKAGDTIRINVRLQETTSGRIVSTDRVDAANEAALFPTIDELTRRVKTGFVSATTGNTPGRLFTRVGAPTPPPGLDRDLKDVTTASMEAYRHYAAGIEQHQGGRPLEALPHFERAVEIDRSFALAYAKMAVISGNIGRSNDRDTYARRAIALVERLTPRERYYIEGYFYSNNVHRLAQAVSAYEKALDLYPDHSASRNNLAALLYQLGRYDQAGEHLTLLRERGYEFPGAALIHSGVYLSLAKPTEAVEVITSFTDRYPNVEAGHMFLGFTHLALSRLDDAQRAFERALALRPGFPRVIGGLAQAAVLRDDFSHARNIGRPLLATTATGNSRSTAVLTQVLPTMYEGRMREALRLFDQLAAHDGATGSEESATARAWMARLRRATGNRAAAVVLATRAASDAGTGVPVVGALYQGAAAGSTELRAALQRTVAAVPSGPLKVMPLLADAELAIEEGRDRQTLDNSQRVLQELPPGVLSSSTTFPPRQPRVVAEYLAGRARLGLGDADGARRHFQWIVNSGYWRLFTPVEYVRSLYYLGQIEEKHGDAARAREYYSRFLTYWRNGDIDRDKVAEAIKKTS